MKILTNSYEDILSEKPIIEASPWGTDGYIIILKLLIVDI